MALKRELLLIFVLLITIAVLVQAVDFFSVSVESSDAAKFVLEDLRYKYPDADISILETKELYNENSEKYYEVKAKVTQGLDSACPRRVHIFYNYPDQNFVPQPADVITANCRVCTEGTCIMNFEEEAIIASHTFSGTTEVSTYIVSESAKPTVSDLTDSWLVTWDSDNAGYFFEVTIDKSGEILNLSKIEKVI
jgi:hypothetical protein